MRSGLGWQSLDPMEAVAAVHSIENKNLLLRIAYEARNPEARRLALIKMGDKGLMASFAQSDIFPIVRRRMVRELDDIELVSRIADNDDDRSVRESARQRLAQLEALQEKDAQKSTECSDQGKEKITADGSNGLEYVDLGLSVKWAAMNIGAAKATTMAVILPGERQAIKMIIHGTPINTALLQTTCQNTVIQITGSLYRCVMTPRI